MIRLHLPPERFQADRPIAELVVDGDVARRLSGVLRMKPGDPLRVFDGAGRERLARFESATRRNVTLSLLDHVEPPPEAPLPVTLACAFPRGNRGDWLVEKATELGVARIVPLEAARSVLEPGDRRLERWRRIATEAAEQCERAVVPPIEPPVAGAAWAPPAGALALIADLEATSPVREAIPPRLEALDRSAGLVLLVGPEGDWTPAERDGYVAAGAVPVTLGPRVLRVETAAVVFVAQAMEAIGALEGPAVSPGA